MQGAGFAQGIARRHGAKACALAAAFVLGRLSVAGPHQPVETEATRQADRIARELDALEADLQGTEGFVATGRNLQARHEKVSALHCASVNEQAELGARLSRDQSRKKAARRVSEAAPVDLGGGSDVGMIDEREAPSARESAAGEQSLALHREAER